MSRYWIITKETESFLPFRDIGNLLTFLYDHQKDVGRFRVLKNKNDSVVEVYLSHLLWKDFREALESS